MKKFLFVGFLVLVLLVSGCITNNPGFEQPSGPGDNETPPVTSAPPSGERLSKNDIVEVKSAEDLKGVYTEALGQTLEQGFYRDSSPSGTLTTFDTESVDKAPDVAEDIVKFSKTRAEGSDEFSKTNIQEKGVDEGDIVKTDGEYIYYLNNHYGRSSLVILKAYPTEDAKIVFKKKLPRYSDQDILLKDDKLVLITSDRSSEYRIYKYEFNPSLDWWSRDTRVLVYDVKNPSNPVLEKNISLPGSYIESRLYGNDVFLLTRKSTDWIRPIPLMYSNGELVRSHLYYFRDEDDLASGDTTTLTKISLDGNDIVPKSFLTPYYTTFYMSPEHIFIAYRKKIMDYSEMRKKIFYNAVVPLYPDEVRKKILDAGDDWVKIESVLLEYYNTLSGSEKKEFLEKAKEASDMYRMNIYRKYSKTVIRRFDVDDLEYSGGAEVNGYLLDQWSLSEFNGRLRVATTVSVYDSSNNVYILDEDLDVVGKAEGLAEGERIKSSRFIGNTLYLVTYKQIDPFFVIDLSGDEPEVLGFVKLPGYSTYLHPYDDSHILGVGINTKMTDSGFERRDGVKLTLFDVSDPRNPVEVSTYIINNTYNSEALWDHHAFLFSKKKNLIVIPASTYIKGHTKYVDYVFGVSSDFKIYKRGVVWQSEEHDDWGDYYYNYRIKRNLFIDSVLYTLSDNKMVAFKLHDGFSDDLEFVKEVFVGDKSRDDDERHYKYLN